MIRKRFSLRKTIIKDFNFGLVRMYVTPYRFSLTIFILGLALSYTDKLLVFRWVQIVLHLYTVGNHVTIDVCLIPLWGAAIFFFFASKTTDFAFFMR